MLMQIVPLKFYYIGTKWAFCGLQNTLKYVFSRGSAADPQGELTMLSRPPSQLRKGHPFLDLGVAAVKST